METNLKKKVYVHVTELLHCIPETNIPLYISYISILKKAVKTEIFFFFFLRVMLYLMGIFRTFKSGRQHLK